MNRKPWQIYVLALFQWLSPIGNLIISAVGSHMSVGTYLELSIRQYGLLYTVATMFVPQLILGFAVYAVKPWSYPVFLACSLYLSYESAVSAIQSPGNGLGIAVVGTAIAVNMAVGTYFLLPEVRKPYFQRRLRWWEAQPRLAITLPSLVYSGHGFTKETSAQALNLSRGGALLEVSTDGPLSAGDVVALSIRVPENSALEVFCEGKIVHIATVHRLHAGPVQRVGVEFQGLSRRSRKNLNDILAAFELLKAPFIREKTGLIEDTRFWTQELLTQLEILRRKSDTPESKDTIEKKDAA